MDYGKTSGDSGDAAEIVGELDCPEPMINVMREGIEGSVPEDLDPEGGDFEVDAEDEPV